ncbi:unnamed protein product [Linum tenue]|uniref:Uncharacterized protein n=1 Tax=Linum tenue TaxID=586396 RepID=A0AAV0N5Z8_9ROSI|nr:unnamed protein product [Linum tenue]
MMILPINVNPFDEVEGESQRVPPSQSPTPVPPTTKLENCDIDVMEIRQQSPQLHPQPHHLPQPLDHAPMATIDSEEYRAFHKSQLDLACAVVAMTRRY